MGDFFGFALETAAGMGFAGVALVVFFGKAVKMAQGLAHTHAGRADLALVIPARFGRDLETGDRPEVQVLVDGQNSNTAAVAAGYANRILFAFMQDHLLD